MGIVVSKLVDLSTRLVSNEAPERKGGVFTYLPREGSEMQSYRVGVIADEDLVKFFRFSREKVHRALADWMRNPDTVSSWETRDEEMQRYGGGILINHPEAGQDYRPGALAFSGLKEHVDEAISIVAARDFGLITPGQARRIVTISGNTKVWPELVAAYEAAT